MKTNDTKTLLGTMRIPFLILTPASIFLGFATSFSTSAQINFFDLALVFLGALSAHISVNMFNEYHDFHSGLDAKTVKTPFSGGSGALLASPKTADAVFYLAMISLTITIFIGIYFIFNLGFKILPLGVVGVLIVLTYTQWINRHPFLCLVAPGLGFGPLMVVGTHVALTGEYSMFAFFVSLVPFFLVNNLLLLNQYPDIVADKSVGRRHFPIAYGVRKSSILYGIFVVAACDIILVGVLNDALPTVSYFSLIPMVATFVVFFGTMKYAGSVKKLIPYLGMNVFVTILTPVLLALSIIYG